MAPQTEEVTFNVVTDDYGRFIRYLRDRLADHDDELKMIEKRPVLRIQRYPKRPARWIHIKLVGETEATTTTLAVRDDNVYLIGFMNQKGKWYEFGISGVDVAIIQGSTFLGYGADYPSIVGDGGAKNLVGVELNRGFAIQAVRRLSAYGEGGAYVDIKLDLARLIVMICESARMCPHYNRVKGRWTRQDGSKINEKEVGYLKKWGDTSGELLEWKLNAGNYEWPRRLKKIGIKDAGKALNVVELLLNTKPRRAMAQWPIMTRIALFDEEAIFLDGAICDEEAAHRPMAYHGLPQDQLYQGLLSVVRQCWREALNVFQRLLYSLSPRWWCWPRRRRQPAAADDDEGHGRPLVEVLAMNANFDSCTIAVFDGIRGQIIYKHDQGRTLHPPTRDEFLEPEGFRPSTVRDFRGNMVLTGPYTAISAYGSFAIEVDINNDRELSPTGESSSVGGSGTLFWDCYDDARAVYDTPLTDTIETGHGPVKVTYAVLSNAVEATVQVKLQLAGVSAATADRHALVYGNITARSQDFTVGSVLFSRESEEKVALTSSSIVPLARSVVAVPLGSPLVIEARLYVVISKQDGTSPSFQGDLVFFSGGEQHAKHIRTEHGEVGVNITWSPDFDAPEI